MLWGDVSVASRHQEFAGVAAIYLAVGDDLQPLGDKAILRAEPGKARTWNTCALEHRTGRAGEDAAVGKDLYVVIAGRVEGPGDLKTDQPIVFVRWDSLTLLTGEAP